MSRLAGLIISICVGFAIFYFGAVTPPPAGLDAPDNAFSAARAMRDIRTLGGQPHPAGSPANARVRDYLIGRMTALGLHPVAREDDSVSGFGSTLSGARVHNLIGVIPGADSSAPALALMAHYDSVPGSPGAADDAAGVASALEIVRALKTKGIPRRDVVVLLTDGEEAGLLGARAFFARDPLAAHVGYVLNMESRGGGGRAIMFETARSNGQDIALYRRTAAAPVSNALTVLIYRFMPNSTDFTAALMAGKVGLNYAFIGRQFDYHSPSSTPATLDQGALQHMGAQVLPTAEALAFGPLPSRAPDVTYANLLGDATAAYPANGGWLLLFIAVALIAFGLHRIRGAEALDVITVGRGVLATLYAVLLTAVALELVRRATGVASGFIEFRPILAQFPLFEVMMAAAALAAVLATATLAASHGGRRLAVALPLAAAAIACLFSGLNVLAITLGILGGAVGFAGFGAVIRLPAAWLGALLVSLFTGVAVQLAAPTAGAVFAWPLVAGAATFAAAGGGASRSFLTLVVSTFVSILVCGWLAALFHQLLQGLDLAPIVALPAFLALSTLWPLLHPRDDDAGNWRLPSIGITVGLGIAAYIHLHNPWTERHPNSVEPIYIVEPAAGRAWRASALPPDRWTSNVIGAESGRIGSLDIPLGRADLVGAPAAATAVAAPNAVLATNAAGRVTLSVTPRPNAVGVIIALRSSSPLRDIDLNGRGAPGFTAAKTGWSHILWSGAEPLTLSLSTADARSLDVVVAERLPTWMAASPLPALPPTDQMWSYAGSTLVLGRPTLPPPLTPER